MLLTGKAEILEAMNKELADAPDSSVKWLENTFNEPLTNKKKRPVQLAYTGIQTAHSRKYSKGKPVTVSIVVSSSRKRYVLKLNKEDILLLKKQNEAFSAILSEKINKYSEHRTLKRV